MSSNKFNFRQFMHALAVVAGMVAAGAIAGVPVVVAGVAAMVGVFINVYMGFTTDGGQPVPVPPPNGGPPIA